MRVVCGVFARVRVVTLVLWSVGWVEWFVVLVLCVILVPISARYSKLNYFGFENVQEILIPVVVFIVVDGL